MRNIKLLFSSLLLGAISFCAFGGQTDTLRITIQKNEKWYGGFVADGHKAPFKMGYRANQLGDNNDNQVQPLLVSNLGSYIWCDDPIGYEFKQGTLQVFSSGSKIQMVQTGTNLKGACLSAAKSHFPPSGKMPDDLLFAKPQYNTWIELIYDQNEKDIEAYAQKIIDNGYPAGVLMIDDNWQEDYGVWEFKAETFKDPKGLINKLHAQGFKVMLWVCPFVSPDSYLYRQLRDKGLFLKNAETPDQPLMVAWWNGYSALLDFTNPDAVKWFEGQLKGLQEKYGVDGFKLDAGDFYQYPMGKYISHVEGTSPNEHSELYAKIGLNFKLNEYRACWKMGNQPLAQRLKDKRFEWEDLQTLIPDLLTQGLIGYPFACPDLIGGGHYISFLNLDHIDQELIVRSAQIHALLPMMQFSLAPWRVLDTEHQELCKQAALLHAKFGSYILQLANYAAQTGEPIARHLEYEFPNQGFSDINDQFMLGDKYLVAPVIEKGAISRLVALPTGKWKSDTGQIFKGGQTIQIDVPLSRLPYFERITSK